MTLRERITALHRLQQQRGFKIIASATVLVVAVALLISYVVSIKAQSTAAGLADPRSATPSATQPQDPSSDTPTSEPDVALAKKTGSESDKSKNPIATDEDLVRRDAGPGSEIDATAQVLKNILRGREDPTGVSVAITITSAVALVVIWLGLGLTYLAMIAISALVVTPMLLWGGRSANAWIIGVIGLVGLLASFSALMQAAKIVLSGPGPVFAIAKNLLAEATRAKLSLIFIVLLVLGMALLPHLLNPDQPLRYRVQTFMQSSTAGSFWLIAILILLFSITTVAFEQRDKVIWQTMTKPVAHWQYILGKWLGVCVLGLILLTVSGAGVFIFTGYLRSQAALGEVRPYVSADSDVAPDRLVLETQILSARESRKPDDPEFDEKVLRENIDQKVDMELQRLGDLSTDPNLASLRREELTQKIRTDVIKSLKLSYRSIEPGGTRVYQFSGLEAAKESNLPIQLRLKCSAGSNMPDQIYKLTIEIAGSYPVTRDVGLGQFYNFPLLPTCINDKGEIYMRIQNGYIGFQDNQTVVVANPETVSFGADGIEISYTAGSFGANFIRAYIALAIKLCFLAMVAICASTFLSFPVASLVSFGVFLAAEGAGFLKSALENFATEDQQGKVLIFNTITAKITEAVATVFGVYAELRPTTRLVDGIRLSWGQMAMGLLVLSIASLILFLVAVVIFRRRELATYSGQ